MSDQPPHPHAEMLRAVSADFDPIEDLGSEDLVCALTHQWILDEAELGARVAHALAKENNTRQLGADQLARIVGFLAVPEPEASTGQTFNVRGSLRVH